MDAASLTRWERYDLVKVTLKLAHTALYDYNLLNLRNWILPEIYLIKIVQGEPFPDEIRASNSGKNCRNRTILHLARFLDDDGIIHVGERLKNAEFAVEQCYRISLHYKHILTKILRTHRTDRLINSSTIVESNKVEDHNRVCEYFY